MYNSNILFLDTLIVAVTILNINLRQSSKYRLLTIKKLKEIYSCLITVNIHDKIIEVAYYTIIKYLFLNYIKSRPTSFFFTLLKEKRYIQLLLKQLFTIFLCLTMLNSEA